LRQIWYSCNLKILNFVILILLLTVTELEEYDPMPTNSSNVVNRREASLYFGIVSQQIKKGISIRGYF
jgi:hypothetical protein